jgi:hypothetical protein
MVAHFLCHRHVPVVAGGSEGFVNETKTVIFWTLVIYNAQKMRVSTKKMISEHRQKP